MTFKEFKPLVKELLDSGWKMTAPDAQTLKAEDEACNKAICAHCGNKGLAYMPFTGPARPKPTATLSTYRLLRFVQDAVTSRNFDQSTEEIMPMTIAEVFELIEPADPDSIRALGNNEFALSWLKGGFTPEQLAGLQGNEKIAALVGPYQPKDEPWITHQIRIRVN